MDTQEKKIEEFLKNTSQSVHPTRESFNIALEKSVTKNDLDRNTSMKEHTPSPYYLITSMFSKKTIWVAVPLVLIVIVTLSTNDVKTEEVAYKPKSETSVQIPDENISSVDASIDRVVSDFVEDATQDANLALDNEDEQVALAQEFESFNNLTTYSYESNI